MATYEFYNDSGTTTDSTWTQHTYPASSGWVDNSTTTTSSGDIQWIRNDIQWIQGTAVIDVGTVDAAATVRIDAEASGQASEAVIQWIENSLDIDWPATTEERRQELEEQRRLNQERLEREREARREKEKVAQRRGMELLKASIGDILFHRFRKTGRIDIASSKDEKLRYRIRHNRRIALVRKQGCVWIEDKEKSLCVHLRDRHVKGDELAAMALLAMNDEDRLVRTAIVHKRAA